jgi:hypothetical protein
MEPYCDILTLIFGFMVVLALKMFGIDNILPVPQIFSLENHIDPGKHPQK